MFPEHASGMMGSDFNMEDDLLHILRPVARGCVEQPSRILCTLPSKEVTTQSLLHTQA